MLIKDILVHVDALPACSNRLHLAAHLARRFDAYLIGGFVTPTPDMVALTDTGAAAVALSVIMARLEEEAAAAEADFAKLLRAHDVPGEWRFATGTAVSHIPRWANGADLLVLGQNDPDHPSLEAPETIILSCGRPSLVVPYAGRFDGAGETVLIAWNGSREACRAEHDALPFLTMSSAVTALTVNPDTEDATTLQRDVVQHLARHGLKAKAEVTETKELTPSELVLSRASDLSADLLVMGAYSHSRLREMVLGGMTRDILRHMTVPVLTAH